MNATIYALLVAQVVESATVCGPRCKQWTLINHKVDTRGIVVSTLPVARLCYTLYHIRAGRSVEVVAELKTGYLLSLFPSTLDLGPEINVFSKSFC